MRILIAFSFFISFPSLSLARNHMYSDTFFVADSFKLDSFTLNCQLKAVYYYIDGEMYSTPDKKYYYFIRNSHTTYDLPEIRDGIYIFCPVTDSSFKYTCSIEIEIHSYNHVQYNIWIDGEPTARVDFEGLEESGCKITYSFLNIRSIE